MSPLQVFLSVVVAGAIMPSSFAGGSCPHQHYPWDVAETYRCNDKDQTSYELIVCASGPDGFDENEKDFDVAREMIDYTNLKITLDNLAGTTFFIPYDLAFHRLHAALLEKKEHELIYDESATVQYLKTSFNATEMTKVLQYHISPIEYTFLNLQKEITIETLYNQRIVLSEKAEKTSNCKKRVRLCDEYRLDALINGKKLKDGFPKIHNKFQDLHTKNGIAHVIKGVLIPKL